MDFFQLLIVNKARRTGAPCINNPLGDPRSMPLDADHSPPPSEDCLHLSGPQWLRFPPSPLWLNCQAIFQPRNIWTPSKVKRASMPVMVYNFGGGLCSGYAGNPYFNGFLVLIRSHVSRCLHQAKRRDVSSGGTIVILLDSR